MKSGAASEVRGVPEVHPEAQRVSAEEGYRLWAATYDLDPNPLLALEERTLTALLSDVRGRDVLDLACGTGRWLAKAQSWGAWTAVGVDLSAAMLGVACGKPGLRGCLVRGDCRALPLGGAVADLVICSFALEHLEELEEAAAEMARVSRPGADLFISDLDPRAHARGWRAGFRSNGAPVAVASFAHPAEEIRQAFEASGFELERRVEAHLGEPEQPIFERAGRAHLFESARATPAVLVCQFKRLDGRRAGL